MKVRYEYTISTMKGQFIKSKLVEIDSEKVDRFFKNLLDNYPVSMYIISIRKLKGG